MSKRVKRFCVTNGAGIPFCGQDYMTEQECEEWIARDIKDLRENCGITAIRNDYGIFDSWGEGTWNRYLLEKEVI